MDHLGDTFAIRIPKEDKEKRDCFFGAQGFYDGAIAGITYPLIPGSTRNLTPF